MFDEETLMGESIDFQAPMNAACSRVRPKDCRRHMATHLPRNADTHA
jgi:hypothetical protein